MLGLYLLGRGMRAYAQSQTKVDLSCEMCGMHSDVTCTLMHAGDVVHTVCGTQSRVVADTRTSQGDQVTGTENPGKAGCTHSHHRRHWKEGLTQHSNCGKIKGKKERLGGAEGEHTVYGRTYPYIRCSGVRSHFSAMLRQHKAWCGAGVRAHEGDA